jgi:asparagine synthase (glutamine-hydrolysing)
MLLRDGDVMSMAHGLEVRVPYLDHVLIERVFAESSAAKQSRTVPKPLLVRAVLPELPRAIYDRKKMGFTFPWEEWLRGRLRVTMEETYRDGDAAAAVGLSLPACSALWSSFLARRNGVTWSRVWALTVLLRWSRHHLL